MGAYTEWTHVLLLIATNRNKIMSYMNFYQI